MNPRPECTHKDAHYDWTSGDAQLYWRAHARNHDRDAAEEKAQDNADEQREKVWSTKLLLLISKHFRHSFNSVFTAHDSEFVTQLKMQSG